LSAEILRVHPDEPQPDRIDYIVFCLRKGDVVALPTDTFYGLAVDPVNLHAVEQIYQIKTRQKQKPLSLLIATLAQAYELARDTDPMLDKLADRFWPGPLTIIMPASPTLPLRATGNTGRLAVRQAQSRIVDELLARLDQPLIATSANLSGRPTCTSGIEVFGVMDGRVDLVLDGGPSVGVGATTLDITEQHWRIIREGSIAGSEIAECLEATD